MRFAHLFGLSIISAVIGCGAEDPAGEPDRVLSSRLGSATWKVTADFSGPTGADFRPSGALTALLADAAGTQGFVPASQRAAALLPLAKRALDAPLAAVGQARGLSSQPNSTAQAIRAAATQLGEGAEGALVYPPESFDSVLGALCDSYGCQAPEGALSDAWEQALAPVLRAVLGVMEARAARSQALSCRSADFWARRGAYGLLPVDGLRYDPVLGEDRAYVVGGRRQLYAAAAALAAAVEDARWPRQAEGYALSTGAGWILIRGAGDDRYEANLGATLLIVDVGGDDLYLAPVAANQGGDNPVSLLVDLGGDDRYTYPEAEAWRPGTPLPADAQGRHSFNPQQQEVSASLAARQGAGRNGVALLFDLGEGADRYEALRSSQGYAHQGVGVLFDDGGDDAYTGELAVQGAGQFGIGLLIDRGGDDRYQADRAAQGFGYVAGFGALYDRDGADHYRCTPGVDGAARYRSFQHPADGAASFCQGAGFGLRLRGDAGLAGGLGLLADAAGNDRYEAGVFAQGSGYYNGLGVLVDAAGDDQYDAIHYAQGGAAHHAAGWLLDLSGDDVYNAAGWAKAYVLGAGWDGSVGVAYDAGGDDHYTVAPTSGGMGGAGGLGVLLDQAGADDYDARFTSNLGYGIRADNRSGVGLFVDGAGGDHYGRIGGEGARWTGGLTNNGAGQDGQLDFFSDLAGS